MKRICKICFEEKDLTKFLQYKHTVNNKEYTSIDSYCRDCRRLYDKEQRRIQRARKKEAYIC